MSNTLIKSQLSWADACLDSSTPWSTYAAVSGLSPLSAKLRGAAARPGGGVELPQRREAQLMQAQRISGNDSVIGTGDVCKQRVQDEQGTTVFSEDTIPNAPATAHVGATAKGGELGPFPWRRPV
ncbi:hypothetical protein [Actinomadura rudentiformis]|uniref:Uncharacterized protein n=1 Tax=Actinomadura rudentiformis TaxID=359158 RepID=A0A6H9YHH3_9ACTN|nr:hypothetical protein [Actinomadura rudentiformis]KAB2343405.1 hypothetical protein F8566_35340 [Actinomadura rudentiformis]